MERVLRHAECAKTLLDAKQHEGAFLFILLGFEELGKLIELIDAAQVAEANQSAVAEIPGFLVHGEKAEQSAKNVARAFDLLIPPLRDAGVDTNDLEDYVRHLTDIKENFETLREGMMYVDVRDGKWVIEQAPGWDLTYMDYNTLYFSCAAIWSNLRNAKDFRGFVEEFNKAVVEFKQQFPQLVEGLMKGVAEKDAAGGSADYSREG